MNKEITFEFEKLPKDVTELQQAEKNGLTTPFETAALTVLALMRYPESSEDSVKMLNYLKGPQELTPYELQFLKDRFRDKDYVPKSYVKGAEPQNSYEAESPYRITVSENQYSYDQAGYAKLYLKSSGADSSRPVVLRVKGNRWYLWEQMLLADIRKPVSEDAWA